ncbi:hypothetical protein AEGHOMDF_2064 [Methylobacterium soli]|nr:hypothetical protein AEGHOMDF_2064 [Methylobacterium soli]
MLRGPRRSLTGRHDLANELANGRSGLPGAAPVEPCASLTRGAWSMPHDFETTLASRAPRPGERLAPRAGSEPRDYVVWTFVAMAASCAFAWGGLTLWIVWGMLAS